jgi:hypothetical protein
MAPEETDTDGIMVKAIRNYNIENIIYCTEVYVPVIGHQRTNCSLCSILVKPLHLIP